jgi:hypothetical protein
VPEVDRCDATSKSSPSKLRADPTPLHATEVLIATLSDPWENTLPETSEGPTVAVGRLALERHLRHVLLSYMDYYNRASEHPSVYVVEEKRLC